MCIHTCNHTNIHAHTASGYRFIGVKPLEDDAALTKGINFLSESFVFLVAGSIIIIEYNKSEEKSALAKEAAKEEKQKIKEALEERFKEIDDKIIAVENKISDIEKILPEETLNMINLRQALRSSGSSPEEIDKKTSENQTSQLAIVKISKKDRGTTLLPLPPPSASSSIWFKIWSLVKI